MANYSTLKAAVADVVKTNGTQAITGANLQAVLLSIINSVGGGGYIFKGVATPSTSAGTPDENVFYLGGAGTYANFGASVTVPVGSICVFKYNGSWTNEQIETSYGGVFDISEYHATGGTLATYADLAAALGNGGANVPSEIRKGGMCISFVQSSDNKYVQYRYMSTSTANADIANVVNWQGVDDEPTAGSENVLSSKNVPLYSVFSKNLFNKNSPQNLYGKYLLSNGNLDNNANYMVTHYIPFIPGMDNLYITVNGTPITGYYGSYICFYDKDFNIITSLSQRATSLVSHDTNVMWVRFSIPNYTNGNIQVEIGNKYTGYSEFGIVGSNKIIEEKLSEIQSEFNSDLPTLGNTVANFFLYKYSLKDNGTYMVGDAGVYTYNVAQQGYICQVLKGSTITLKSNTVDVSTKFRFGFFKQKPNVGDTASYYEHIVVNNGNSYNYSYTAGETGYIIISCIPYTGMLISIDNIPVIPDGLKDSIEYYKYLSDEIGYQKEIPMVEGYYSLVNQSVGSEFNDTILVAGTYKCAKCSCNAGDAFVFNLTGGYTTGKYVFTDANGIILTMDKAAGTLQNAIIIAPNNAKFLYFSDSSNSVSYYGREDKIKILSQSVKQLTALNHFEISDNIASGVTKTGAENYTRKNISLYAEVVFSESPNVIIGLGKTTYRGMWFEIDSTNIKVYWDESGSVLVDTYAHGLTLTDKFYFTFDREITSGIIKLISGGNVFTQNIQNLGFHGGGASFITNNGSASISAKVSVFPRDIEESIWLFGDSYLSFDNNERWLYYMLDWGYNHWFSDSLPGVTSPSIYSSFENDINLRTPKIAVWCLGMNDASDIDVNTPNSSWLSRVEQFIEKCKSYNVTPLLATIPSVPSKSHEGKNKWVRESGYRYIDFASAVDAQADGTWGTGYLSSDNVHPTSLGAKMLACQVLIDLPEITIK